MTLARLAVLDHYMMHERVLAKILDNLLLALDRQITLHGDRQKETFGLEILSHKILE